ncbi:hypothetical protein JVU11DRAFT_58 [Chiua virens]|nr:hypothetical protein JVU11DRAFT_58 [Chiua virens]
MPGESPPPYSAVIATLKPLIELRSAPTDTTLPFSQSGQLATKILALVSEGKTLDSRFKDIRDVAMGVTFDSQTAAVSLRDRSEQLIWESRNIAGIALVAIKDFNEVVLDFLSEPDVAVQDRLKELASASQLLQKERNSAANHKSSFDALLQDVEHFYHMIIPASIHKRRRRKVLSGRKETKDTQSSQQLEPPFIVPPAEPANSLLSVSASLGTTSRSYIDQAQHVERAIDMTILSWLGINSPLETPVPGPDDLRPSPSPSLPENSRLEGTARKRSLDCGPMDPTESVSLPGLMRVLVQDLRGFTSRVDVLNTVFTEVRFFLSLVPRLPFTIPTSYRC